MALVSIVTPVFNGAKYVDETIESVLAQTYPHVEHILLDDGSTDETPAILRDYAEKYPERVRVYQHANIGQARTVNRGFLLAKGEIIGWINADDYYKPWAVAEAIEIFEKNESCRVCYSGVEYINENRKVYKTFSTLDDLKMDLESIIFHDWLKIAHSSMFFNREILYEIGILDPYLYYALDLEWIMRIALQYELFIKQNSIWSIHRKHGQAKTHSLTAKYRSALDFPYVYSKLANLPEKPEILIAKHSQILARGYWHAAIRMRVAGYRWLAIKYLLLSLGRSPSSQPIDKIKMLLKYLLPQMIRKSS